LITRPERRINALRNEALDFGFQSSDVITFDQWQINWRLGSDARQDVSAQETEISITGEPIFDRLNLDAEQLEFYVAADLSANTNSGAYAGGIRVAHHIQRDKLSNASAEDTNFSAFIGYAYPFAKRWKLAGYLSSAYRVPSLTERFFNGATPRGTTLGDADLDTETAQNAELNLAFENKSSRASLSLFTQRIDHYIERLRVDSETRQYRNLNWAEISGINYQWQHAFDWQSLDWTLNLGGQWIRGEDQASADIADIPPAQHRISMRAQHENSQGFVALTHRQSSDHQVDGELPTSAVTTIDAGYSHTITANIQLSLKFTNLTDKLYITLRDDVAPYARGRDVHLSMEYRF
jgi:iron complex outermembrane receptor protein